LGDGRGADLIKTLLKYLIHLISLIIPSADPGEENAPKAV